MLHGICVLAFWHFAKRKLSISHSTQCADMDFNVPAMSPRLGFDLICYLEFTCMQRKLNIHISVQMINITNNNLYL